MGFLDIFFKKEKEEEEEEKNDSLLSVSVRFIPLRLAAKKDNRVDMVVKIKNESKEEQLVSFEALLPRNSMLGFDRIAVNKHYEKKVGKLSPGKTVEYAVSIYGTTQTAEGQYPIGLVVFVHYLDYNKVITYLKKKVYLRVV